jgi:hypothetical protein
MTRPNRGGRLRVRNRAAMLPLTFNPTLGKKSDSRPFWRVIFSEGVCQEDARRYVLCEKLEPHHQ